MDIASLLPYKENPQKTAGFLYDKIRPGRILKKKIIKKNRKQQE